jgi:hypothetical protein
MFYNDLRPNKNGWSQWKKKFLWFPRKITFEDVLSSTKTTRWIWLQDVYVRHKLSYQYSQGLLIDITTTLRTYEYAEDLFDMMKRP